MEMLCLKSPVGDITLFCEDGNIVALDWGRGLDAPRTSDDPVLNQSAEALKAYFKTGTEAFKDLPLAPQGSPFQKRVWRQMRTIDAGQVKTYGQVAKTLKSSPRAVGNACGANPIPILIPCHRIVGGSSLGGYSGDGGLDTKRTLLRLERYL